MGSTNIIKPLLSTTSSSCTVDKPWQHWKHSRIARNRTWDGWGGTHECYLCAMPSPTFGILKSALTSHQVPIILSYLLFGLFPFGQNVGTNFDPFIECRCRLVVVRPDREKWRKNRRGSILKNRNIPKWKKRTLKSFLFEFQSLIQLT